MHPQKGTHRGLRVPHVHLLRFALLCQVVVVMVEFPNSSEGGHHAASVDVLAKFSGRCSLSKVQGCPPERDHLLNAVSTKMTKTVRSSFESFRRRNGEQNKNAMSELKSSRSTRGFNHMNVQHWKSPPLENGSLIRVNVAQDGTGDFETIQQAIDSVPNRNTQRVIIRISAGTYREKVVVPYNKPFITFRGNENGSTLITGSDTASTDASNMPYSRSKVTLIGTMESASVTILSDGFVAQHMRFENAAPAPEPGELGAQAVAFLIAGDRAAFYFCSFLGAQDTLYDYTGRHYYRSCHIQGSIDFIFGNGRSLFEECALHSIATSFGAIAAHQRLSPEDDTGFSFHRCTVTGSGLLYLGRAWSPYARIVFSRTYFENIIFAEGWSDFGDPRRQSTTFFGQYQCSGPGANLSRRAPWTKHLTDDDVLPYLGVGFVNGKEWLATTLA